MWKYVFLSLGAIIGCVSGYSLVFGGTLTFNTEVSFGTSLGKIIVPGSDSLSTNILVYTSNINISDHEVSSLCDTTSEFLESYKNLYFFEISYNSHDCKNSNVVLKHEDVVYGNTSTNLQIVNQVDLLDTFIDYDSQALSTLSASYKKALQKTAIYKNFNGKEVVKYLKYTIGNRQFKETEFQNKLVKRILEAREKKYVSPVVGKILSTTFTKIPNSPRPYRGSYTDGIHHGWDIDGAIREEVVALDDGVIVRVVDGFDNKTDFGKIVNGDELSYEQKLKNLDVLRGNQVWLKTMKGDVVFYSHLDTIDNDIIEGIQVSRGVPLGKTGVTGVPEVGYDDYHLHFAVMKNPYVSEKAGSYDFGDYMAWDWYGKGLNYEDTVKLQKNTFE